MDRITVLESKSTVNQMSDPKPVTPETLAAIKSALVDYTPQPWSEWLARLVAALEEERLRVASWQSEGKRFEEEVERLRDIQPLLEEVA